MGRITKLQNEIGHLQQTLSVRNKRVAELEEKTKNLEKLAERNLVLAAANEDLKTKLKEAGITWEERQ
jgi:cell division protein FtsB